jgi:tetratricopeptide (TPR) repeat protein
MDPDAIALFSKLADRSPSEREAYYAEHGIGAALRAEVESLLRFDETTGKSVGAYLASAAEELLAESAAAQRGIRYGPFRPIRLIGRGGMGVVYEAEQESPRRIVALKVVNPGLASPELVRRFEVESQALGRLHHPGIAHIYEAGTADTGFGPQPYFAMELVHGETLTRYAQSHRIGTLEKLELIARICDAVHHAHQRGIIHRDLKPGNILIDEAGQPKILDFGVARLTGSEDHGTRQTEVGQLVGTLAYMSPEQVLADPLELDTRSDVYALGVILYELLAGRLPYNTVGNLHDVVRAIREEDPISLGLVNRAYRGDIEVIVARALEKDVARRYASAAELASDIRRYLNDEPLIARPPSAAYQMRKFARRHRAIVMAVAAVFLVLFAGVAVSTWLLVRAVRAERAAAQEAATANAISNFLRTDILAQANVFTQAKEGASPDPDLKVRTALERAAAGIGDRFAEQPAVEASIRHTIGEAYHGLFLLTEARSQFERAFELRRRTLGENHPDTLSSLSRLAAAYVAQGKYPEAEPLVARALEGRRRALGNAHSDTLESMHVLADLYRLQGKPAEAERILHQLLPLRRRLKGDEHTDTIDSRHVLAIVYRLQGKYAQAEKTLRGVLEARSHVQGEEHPDTLSTLNDLIVLLDARGRYAEAEPLAMRLVESERRVLGEQHSQRLSSVYMLGILAHREGKYARAEECYTEALELARRGIGEESAITLNLMNTLGVLLVETGRYAEAKPVLDRTLAGRMRLLGGESSEALSTTAAMAQLQRGQGDYSSAEALLTKVQKVRRRVLPADHHFLLAGTNDLGVLLLAQGKYEQSEALFTEALSGRRRALGDEHPDTLASMMGLVESQFLQGEYARAEPLAREALKGFVNTRPDNWRRSKTESLLGAVLFGQKKFSEAEPLLLSGHRGIIERITTIPMADRSASEQAAEARVSLLYEEWKQPEKAAAWRATLRKK